MVSAQVHFGSTMFGGYSGYSDSENLSSNGHLCIIFACTRVCIHVVKQTQTQAHPSRSYLHMPLWVCFFSIAVHMDLPLQFPQQVN